MKLWPLFRRPYMPPAPHPALETVEERRLIISPDMLPNDAGYNINVPSLIRMPKWATQPLGRYHLYFSSHGSCRYIRLAYADNIDGPWRIHNAGSLRADKIAFIGKGVAAPDVHVDDKRRRIRMYFHASSPHHRRMKAFVATSEDGVAFEALPEALGRFYFRAFPWRNAWYALSKGGRLHRSPDGLSPFSQGPDAFPRIPGNGRNYNAPGSIRHVAVDVHAEHADVYYSRIGDAPECILKSRLDLSGDWRKWHAGPPEEVLRPTETWEGVCLPVAPSLLGAATDPSHQLRDPEFFTDEDGSRYLLYAVAGEQGIAIAHLGRAK